jgi:hypothetical protein
MNREAEIASMLIIGFAVTLFGWALVRTGVLFFSAGSGCVHQRWSHFLRQPVRVDFADAEDDPS